MIANQPQFQPSQKLADMSPEILIGHIVQADLPILQSDVASRIVNSDLVSLRRLSFLAMLSNQTDEFDSQI